MTFFFTKYHKSANLTSKTNVLKPEMYNKMICHTFDIKKYNEANLVLRHFIQRSARLLPIFAELKVSGLKDRQSKQNFSAISNLFEHFNYDDETSLHLMDSNILERIRTCFQAIQNADVLTKESADEVLGHFFKEYNRLLQNWMKIELN